MGIDLPDFVYDPAYSGFTQRHPELKLFTPEDLNAHYGEILHQAVVEKFPALALYLFRQTNPKEHSEEDYKEFQSVLNKYPTVHSSNEEYIAEMILRYRNIQPLLSADIIDNDIHSAFSLGYNHLLPVMFQLFNRTPINYTLNIPLIIRSIGMDPEHFQAYVDTLNLLVPYVNREIPGEAYRNYQLFNAIYNGDSKSVESLLGIYGGPKRHVSGYIWTAILTHHPDIIPLFLNIEEEERLSFLYDYVDHPTLITLEVLQLIGSLSTQEERRVAIRKLRNAGYSDFARILARIR